MVQPDDEDIKRFLGADEVRVIPTWYPRWRQFVHRFGVHDKVTLIDSTDGSFKITGYACWICERDARR